MLRAFSNSVLASRLNFKKSAAFFNKQTQHTYQASAQFHLKNKNLYFFTSGRSLNKKSAQLLGRNLDEFQSQRMGKDPRTFEQAKMEDQFNTFLFNLEELSKSKFTDCETLLDVVERYINQKIFEYKSSDPQTESYGFIEEPILLQHYSILLDIKVISQVMKSSILFRFRKFDEVLTNIENEIYLMDYLKLSEESKDRAEGLCRNYLYILIFHDHTKLRHILNTNYSLNESLFQIKTPDQKEKGRKVSKKSYQPSKNSFQDEMDGHMEKNKQSKSLTTLSKAFKAFMTSTNGQSLLMKSISLAAIGDFDKSLTTFAQLLSSSKHHENLSAFLPIFVFWANENYLQQGNQSYSSESVKQFVKNFLCRTQTKLSKQLVPVYLSPEDSEYVLNSVLSYLHDEPLEWNDLSCEQLGPFCYSVYLIAENFYLNGQKQKAIKMITDLKEKIISKNITFMPDSRVNSRGKPGRKLASKKASFCQPKAARQTDIDVYQKQSKAKQIQNDVLQLITFFQFMKCYDKKDYEFAKNKQEEFTTDARNNFYKSFSVKSDVLRSNIYQILSQTFAKLELQNKSDEYASLKVANYCVNDTYEMNQIQQTISEEEMKMMDFLREKKEAVSHLRKGIPPYYLPLKNPFLTHV